MRFDTQKAMDGESKLAVVMPGAGFSAQTMTKIVDVGNFVFQVYGVRQPTHLIMAGRFGGLLTTAPPAKAARTRFTP